MFILSLCPCICEDKDEKGYLGGRIIKHLVNSGNPGEQMSGGKNNAGVCWVCLMSPGHGTASGCLLVGGQWCVESRQGWTVRNSPLKIRFAVLIPPRDCGLGNKLPVLGAACSVWRVTVSDFQLCQIHFLSHQWLFFLKFMGVSGGREVK